MPSFTGRVYDLPIIQGQLSGAGFFTGRMWPQSAPPIPPALTVLAPVGSAIGTQTLWKAQLVLSPNDGAISRIIVSVSFPSGAHEVVFINDAFTPDYTGKSTIVQTSPGTFVITLLRNGGWPGSPRVYLHANTDRGGMTT